MATQQSSLPLEQYKYQEIGRSVNTVVYKLYQKDENEKQFALKTVPHQQNQHQCQDECLDLINEFKILQNIDHPNIIKVYELKQQNQLFNQLQGEGSCYMALELAQCDLVELVNQQNIKKIQLDLRATQNIFNQICQSLLYLHSKNIVHNDLKMDNFLVFKEDFQNKQFHIKLADFGHASQINLDGNQQQQQQSVYLQSIYDKFKNKNKNQISPEITSLLEQCENNSLNLFKNNKISDTSFEISKNLLQQIDLKKCDIFSLGVALFYSVLWKYPFRYAATENDKFFKHIFNKNQEGFWGNFAKILIRVEKTSTQKQIQNFQDLVFQMLNPNFHERPSIQDVLVHPFFIDF
ncbi:Protein kinase-like domain [Pseudocohnilembus persalinus]|uniref:Protein kinase-like domain n=1 Tax=Pseudocohnilembus persalinus TaxID=266149 RepID=A0A0V0QRR9_PSEPJ|nr:Protein kinase-like domain [Pseudocohnilembus persalinus]|eukprot:KRX04861.1 Protein kinase-like domain [Pseudocohnilembus persalinus]